VIQITIITIVPYEFRKPFSQLNSLLLGYKNVLQVKSPQGMLRDVGTPKCLHRMVTVTLPHIIMDSMTSMFSTDASLPYKHDLVESPIIKKRIKTLIQTIRIEADNANAIDLEYYPSIAASSTKRSKEHALPILVKETVNRKPIKRNPSVRWLRTIATSSEPAVAAYGSTGVHNQRVRVIVSEKVRMIRGPDQIRVFGACTFWNIPAVLRDCFGMNGSCRVSGLWAIDQPDSKYGIKWMRISAAQCQNHDLQ
ncbi:hypothetical protein CLF_113173, partial [Clonorchis sinensis]